uniref:Sialin n=1 Tax=Daphnia magna TaxID=35525 RepID=A0A0P5XE04_9CRUS
MTDEKEMDKPQILAPSLFGSCRLTITMMCLVASFNSLLMTINLGMVIVCMNKVDHSNSTSDSGTSGSNCTSDSEFQYQSTCGYNTTEESDVRWDKNAQGMLLSATYYGVVSMQLLTGWLCDKFGKMKALMIGGSTVLGVVSVLSPLIIQYAGVPFFFAARVVMGACMCFMISPVLPLLRRWTTSKEQGLLVGLAFAGVGLANAATYPMTGLICELSGWRSIFYFCGICGISWSVVALFLIYDTPGRHPRVSVEEKQYLVSTQVQSLSKTTKTVIPWSKILLSVPVWAVITTNFFFFAATKGTVINLPLFVRDVLDFSVTENGIFSAMPSVVALLLHLVIGPLFDYVRAKKIFTVTVVRKTFHVIGTLIPAIMMFIVSQLPPEKKYIIIGLITIGYAMFEFAWMGGFSFAFMDMAPDYVGIIQGINNTIGLMPGFIMPVVISNMTPEGTPEQWSYVFIMFGGLYTAACLIFLIFGNSELQSWGKAKDPGNIQIAKSLETMVV